MRRATLQKVSRISWGRSMGFFARASLRMERSEWERSMATKASAQASKAAALQRRQCGASQSTARPPAAAARAAPRVLLSRSPAPKSAARPQSSLRGRPEEVSGEGLRRKQKAPKSPTAACSPKVTGWTKA